jgi:hypothetical protein
VNRHEWRRQGTCFADRTVLRRHREVGEAIDQSSKQSIIVSVSGFERVESSHKGVVWASPSRSFYSHMLCFLFGWTNCRASSVLQKNTKVNGPKHALDYENTSSSWNSEGSSSSTKPQSSTFILEFAKPIEPSELRIQFQAGFAAEQINVHLYDTTTDKWKPMVELEADDDHPMQSFSLLEDAENSGPTKALKMVFEEPTDFYARITIYQLQVWGQQLQD